MLSCDEIDDDVSSSLRDYGDHDGCDAFSWLSSFQLSLQFSFLAGGFLQHSPFIFV